MVDEIFKTPPTTPVPEITPPKRPVIPEQDLGPQFLPPKTQDEIAVEKPPTGPGLTVTMPGEEPVFEPAQQKIWDVRRQEYVEPYKQVDVPDRPDITKPTPKFPTRDEFETHAFTALGGNPFAIDPIQEVEKATADLKPVFNHVFKNKIYWGDRDKLSPQDKQFWDATVKAYRAQVFQEVTSKRATQIDVYNQMMSKYSDEVNERKAAESKVAATQRAFLAQQKERRIVAEKAAEAKVEARKEERAEEKLDLSKERFEFYKKNAKVKNTKGPSRADIQSIYKDEAGVLRGSSGDYEYVGGIHTGEQLPSAVLEEKNRARRSVGMPELVEVRSEVAETVPTWNPLKGFTDIQITGEYKYLEEPEVEEASAEEVTTTVEGFEAQVLEQYPNAIREGNSWWVPPTQPGGKYKVFDFEEE